MDNIYEPLRLSDNMTKFESSISANKSPSVSEDARSYKSGDDMSGKRSNSSNEQNDISKKARKGRLQKGSNGPYGSKGSLLSRSELENDGSGDRCHASPKFYPKDVHHNTTLQLVKKG